MHACRRVKANSSVGTDLRVVAQAERYANGRPQRRRGRTLQIAMAVGSFAFAQVAEKFCRLRRVYGSGGLENCGRKLRRAMKVAQPMNAFTATRLAVLLSLAAFLSTFGCASLQPGRGALSRLAVDHQTEEDAGAEQPMHPSAVPQAGISMTIRPEVGRTEQLKLPLTPGMTVQSALEQAELPGKFKDMEIKVYRVTPLSQGQAVPLQAEYDHLHDRVGILHDMVLHPGDHIAVVEQNPRYLHDLMTTLTGNAPKRRSQ